MKEAIFLRGHKNNKEFEDAMRQLQNCGRDVYIIYDATDRAPYPDASNVFNFTIEDYYKSGYPVADKSTVYELPTAPPLGSRSAQIYYNPEYAQLLAKKWLDSTNRKYDYYWYLEHDVAFTGEWKNFYDACSALPHDLLCLLLRQYPMGKMFEKFWEQVHYDIPDDNKFAMFGPVWRGSKKLLTTLDKEYKAGKHAFYEIAVPTLAAENGLSLSDINAASGGHDFYHPITMNGKFIKREWTPALIRNSRNMLFHPFTFPPKTLLFATGYLEKSKESFERYERYLTYYEKNKQKLGAYQIAIIDDGSERSVVKQFAAKMKNEHNIDIALHYYDELPQKTGREVLWISFKDRLGRPDTLTTAGWWRSFSFSHIVADKLGFDKLIHIESDTFIFTDRLFKYLADLRKDWTVLYSEHFRFAETCVQAIGRENFAGLKAAWSGGKELWFKAQSNEFFIAEFILPFTQVTKCFKGDRYGSNELWQIPDDCDYASNMGAIRTDGAFEINQKNKINWLKQKIEDLDEGNVTKKLKKTIREKTMDIPVKDSSHTILFATGFINHKEHIKRYRSWIRYYSKIKHELGVDKLVIIDDGSHHKWVRRLYIDLQDNYNLTLNVYDYDNLPEVLPDISWVSFPDNLGRPEYYTTAGWFRSFAFSWKLTQKYDVQKLVHVESDFYLISERIWDWVCSSNKGWHSQWSDHHNMPETAIQIINKDAFGKLKPWWTGGRERWYIGRTNPFHKIAENVLEIEFKAKDFKGDRYGEDWCSEIPPDADYVGNMSNISVIPQAYFKNLQAKLNKFERFIETKTRATA